MGRYTLRVNGKQHTVEVVADTPLLWVLRDALGMTGTKFGCGLGVCGACTVHVDGGAARACMIPISELGSRAVTTIEGLSPDGTHPVQRAWLAEDVAQCGYCQPGQIMAAAALLAGKEPDPPLPAPFLTPPPRFPLPGARILALRAAYAGYRVKDEIL